MIDTSGIECGNAKVPFIEGKGHRRTKSGRSSKRSSRSDIVDNDLVSRRTSRNEDGEAFFDPETRSIG